MAALRAELEKFSKSSTGIGGGPLATALAVTAFNPAVLTGLASVAQGLQQVSQAGLALPGIIGGAVASIGTLKFGMSGMSDALKAVGKAADGSAKDVQAANEALAKLSPNAADVVRTLGSLKPAFDDLKKQVSGEIFAGMSEQIKHLADADLPVLRTGMSKVAQGWNADLKSLTTSLADGKSQTLLDRLLGNTGEAQQRFADAIDPLVKGMGTLVAGSSDALPRLADDLGKVADRFNRFITAADQDGRLNKWINDGITGVEKLGQSVLNIGKAFTAITKAEGGDFLGWLVGVTDKLQAFLNSDAGQDKLKAMFEAGHEELRQLEPIVENLGKILPAMFDAAQNSANIWLPTLKVITDVLASDPALVEAVTSAFLAWKTIDGITSLLSMLGSVSTMLRVTLPADAEAGATAMAGSFAPLLALLRTLPLAIPTRDTWNSSDLGLPQLTLPDSTSGGRNGVTQREHTGKAPLDPTGGVLTNGVGGHASGGPISGPGSGTSDSIPAYLSNGEFVVNAKATAAHLPLLTAINGYATGGLVNPNGNPTTPGMAPGPAAAPPSATPAPMQAGLSNMAQAAMGGLGSLGPIGNFVNMLNAPAPDPSTQTVSQQMGIAGQTQFGTPEGNFAAAASTLPGLWGLVAGLASPDPAGATMNWGTQTVGWLSNFTSSTMSSLGSSLISGGLGAVGLQNSILSPSNPWTGAAMQGANFFLGGSGPLGLMGGSGVGTGGLGGALSSGGGGGSSGGGSPMLMSGRSSSSANGQQHLPLNWNTLDALAAQAGLSMTSGYRSPNGPTIAGVPAAKSYHAQGRAHDYSNGRRTEQELQFANLMASAYGPQLKELIYDDPRFSSTIHDGAVVGPFGAFYTLGQAGDHSDHVHVAFAAGGGVFGSGSGESDSIPAWLSNGEHVLTADDVSAMGGHDNVYAFRNALHRAGGGPIAPLIPIPSPVAPPPAAPPPSPSAAAPSAGPPAPGAPTTPAAPDAPPPPSSPADDAAKIAGAIGVPTIGAAPTSQDHNLPAISKGISSGASAIGNLVSSAIGAASAMGGGMGGGSAGALASTAIQMGGQVLSGAINLGSSLLVGNVPGSHPQDPAYGKPVHAAQNAPMTAPASATTWNVNGISDINRLIQEVDLRDAQHRAGLAKWGG